MPRLRREGIQLAKHYPLATLIDPGKPWQKGTNESFNGKVRDECFSVEWFHNRREAKLIIESWRQHYNAVRPHMSLQYMTPLEFKEGQHVSSTLQ